MLIPYTPWLYLTHSLILNKFKLVLLQSVVKLTNARNVQLHVSYNGMGNSECEVDIQKAFNTTVHLSFQVSRFEIVLFLPKIL